MSPADKAIISMANDISLLTWGAIFYCIYRAINAHYNQD